MVVSVYLSLYFVYFPYLAEYVSIDFPHPLVEYVTVLAVNATTAAIVPRSWGVLLVALTGALKYVADTWSGEGPFIELVLLVAAAHACCGAIGVGLRHMVSTLLPLPRRPSSYP